MFNRARYVAGKERRGELTRADEVEDEPSNTEIITPVTEIAK